MYACMSWYEERPYPTNNSYPMVSSPTPPLHRLLAASNRSSTLLAPLEPEETGAKQQFMMIFPNVMSHTSPIFVYLIF